MEKLSFLFLLLFMCSCTHIISPLPLIPNFPTKCYSIEGDINIAVMSTLTESSPEGPNICGDELDNFYLGLTEASVWAIKEINKRKDLLPNINLGYVVLDTCLKDSAALAQTLYLVPGTCDSQEMQGNCSGLAQGKSKVIGSVGPSSTREAVLAASVLGLFKIPTISPQASSDVLSDKSVYEYFLRVVPPDSYQVEMVFDFLKHMGWSYASFLYSEGGYGENAAKKAVVVSKLKSICIPVSTMLPIIMDENMMDDVIDELIQNIKARVVLIFINEPHQAMLFKAIVARNLVGKFVFVAGDYMYGRDNGFGASGTFVVGFLSSHVPEYTDYYNSIKPVEDGSVWMKTFWERTYGCQWEHPGKNSCYEFAKNKTDKFYLSDYVSLFVDAAYAHAYALQKMITKLCPKAFVDNTLLNDCLDDTGSIYLQYLRNVSFQGRDGPIKFDKNGDSPGKYIIVQFLHNAPQVQIARIDYLSKTFEIYREKIQWDMFEQYDFRQDGIPESVCSKPCKEKEFSVKQELRCCWECRVCRENEIISANFSGCEICPLLYWPDDDTQTLCEKVDADSLLWTDVPVFILMACNILGITLCISSYVWMFKNWNVKLVKASSRELSSITLLGCIMAFSTIIAIIAKPSELSCGISRIGFNLSVAIIFSPLLVKTNRVYRIFQAGKKGNTKPPFVGNRASLLFTFIFIGAQIIALTITTWMAPPVPIEEMKVRTDKYVEVSCDLPLKALLPPLMVNLTIIIFCVLFGFLTRKLPENFNESWYISVSVSTTMFLWVVFLPTYFTTFYAMHKAILLAACLIINAIVTNACLFIPKMYAVSFVDEDAQNTKATGASTVGTSVQ